MVSQKLEIDMTNETGPIRHGACGFLYGLGNDGIPSLNMLTPIKPKVVAQKPPGGLQHPNGDCFDVVDTFAKAGGEYVQIYMQDIYAKWPYESQDINDYLDKVIKIIRAVLRHPRREMFHYVPFNEPDWIWYNVNERKEAFFNDWRTVYRKIRSLDPTAIIVGPNNAKYHRDFYEEFMSFCKKEQCLPDIISWHELESDFFSDWYQHYGHYRSIEKSLGLMEIPICINEYGNWRDLSVPGRLIQWIARLEDCKVDGCLAYWHAAGNLDDLVTQNNQATGAWWLFKWYGDLTGNTVKVIPPDVNHEGLQGLAALDSVKKQIRVIFGGISGDCEIIMDGLNAALDFKPTVGVKVWSIAWSGQEGASPGPVVKIAGRYPVTEDKVKISVTGMDAASAYCLILSEDTEISGCNEKKTWQAILEAEEAEITDCEVIAGGTASNPNQNFHSNLKRVAAIEKDTSRVRFTVDVPFTGNYRLDIFYGNGHGSMAQQLLMIDDASFQMIDYHPNLTWGFIDCKTLVIGLTEGRHELTFAKFDAAFGPADLSVDLDKIELHYISKIELSERYEPQYAGIFGGARIDYQNFDDTGGSCVVLDGQPNSGLLFPVPILRHGYYRLKIRYAGIGSAEKTDAPVISIKVNETFLKLSCSGLLGPKQWNDCECRLFFPAGINQIAFWGGVEGENRIITIDSIELLPDNGKIQTYEAEAPENILCGTVKINEGKCASGGQYVSGIGMGAGNYLELNHIRVAKTGTYCMVVYYAGAEKVGAHQYNVNIVDRYADIRINGKEDQRVYYRNTFGWNSFRSKVVQIQLKAGENTIRFFNNEAKAPHIDKIEIAPFRL